MKNCKHCNDTLFSEVYDTCMTCYENLFVKSTMTKTVEQYQQDCIWYQNEIIKLKNELETETSIAKRQKDILNKILFELPVGNAASHTYECIPEHVAYYVKESAQCEDTKENQSLVDDNRKLHDELSKLLKVITNIGNECNRYQAALEEIVKRPRKSETCKMIAQQALGTLNDSAYQPELLIEENLRLKMKVEDLQAVINGELLNKVFNEQVNPLMQCDDCGEYWDYHHEQHCKANL